MIGRHLILAAILGIAASAASAGPAENKATATRIFTERMGQGDFSHRCARFTGPASSPMASAATSPWPRTRRRAGPLRAAFPDLAVRVDRIIAEVRPRCGPLEQHRHQ